MTHPALRPDNGAPHEPRHDIGSEVCDGRCNPTQSESEA